MSDSGQDRRLEPHYALAEVAPAFSEDRYHVPARVARHVRSRGWDRTFVSECMCSLTNRDLHKSEPHRTRDGVWLDVYRPMFAGERMYVKLTAHERHGWFVVLSFCVDGTAH